MSLQEMTDRQLLDALAAICRRKGWTIQDVEELDAQEDLVTELNRRGLKLERGHDEEKSK